jgi:preprotein translocase subunit YajC
MEQLIPLLLMIGLIYFLLIRPQQQEQAAHQTLMQSLAKDDRVVTQGGLWGKVVRVEETTVTLDLGDKVRIKVDKDAVARRSDTSQPA